MGVASRLDYPELGYRSLVFQGWIQRDERARPSLEDTFVGQLGISQIGNQDGDEVDFKYYLAPEYYEQYITTPEWQHPPLYITPDFPSGEIAGQSSAAMAVGALVFKELDIAYADSLIVHAKV
jgi:hypothetical protein